jgi:hypothetical protein
VPPHELRPAPWRPSLAPAAAWDRFDGAVEALSRARTGVSVIAVSRSFGVLADAAYTLAAAIDEQQRANRTTSAA